MGTLVGHVAPGFGFFVIGLWHLFNHIKLHALHPQSYTSSPWFSTSRFRYLELYLIMLASSISISMELFIGPARHQPFDTDGTIPSNHLHNFEHSNISLTFFVYSLFSIVLDKLAPPAAYGFTNLLAAVAFAQQLLVFHLHSADHMGVEGQYHWLLQILIFISLLTTLLGIKYPNSFFNSLVRSVSILFQGVWLMVMGFMLWTPSLIPKACFMNLEEGHRVVRCHGEEALERAKSLVNIQFSWCIVGVTIFSVIFYLIVLKFYRQEVEYKSLMHSKQFVLHDDDDDDDLDPEAQKMMKLGSGYGEGESGKSFLEVGKQIGAMDMER